MMLHTKYLGCSYSSFRGGDFQSWHSENPFIGPCDILMQPTGTIYITCVGDHPRIIAVKFHQNPLCSGELKMGEFTGRGKD